MPSHTNLLNPFKKNYPSLKKFEYRDEQLEDPQLIINILELNTQLVTLNIELCCWNNALMTTICRHLTILEEFKLVELSIYTQSRIDKTSKFSHSTKIKKLNLCWDMLSPSSLESILLNCPQLEELKIESLRNHLSQEYFTTFNISRPTKIKKLEFGRINLSVSSLNSIFLNCPQLNDLNIRLPVDWKEAIKSVGSKCMDLKHLSIRPINPMQLRDSNGLFLELYQNEFLSSNSIYISTLTSLTLIGFNFSDSRAEYFKNFANLNSITYLEQDRTQYTRFKKEDIVDKEMWPGYRYILIDHKCKFDVKLIKL
ncbi:hypothetical protein CONCODRAFT_138573 [Conidiobolus coronatus NRRL 28638]|uniref:RNI-like protein n=1 Tax=Conidiobolus coronatus (strain ATCC 28846 / CBS 209.66 / NRRL 28638) TaxID=796925 RepID=A0A137NSN0_CONC2|nr:hypothetical protein CONCODRAFT_138573 [Conidiobolus coronatus NRRL 28638]|eukprot:KXN65702.1 hypothetical protein CONCODRAFT_138573 [Conidiobolus coronatus NRRL 28638]